jgi:hypothetical protein
VENKSSVLIPKLLPRIVLHQCLRPEMKPRAFANWLWRAEREQGFPEPVRTGKRSCAWREDEVLAWLESRERGGRFDGRRPTKGAPAPEAA